MSTAKLDASWKLKVAVVVLSCGLGALLLEGGLRLQEELTKRRASDEGKAKGSPEGEFWAEYDPDLLYKLNPRFGDISKQGIRDHIVPPKSDRFRLLMLGDSIGFYGDSLDDTFVGHLRAELRRNPATTTIEVVNGCIKGYSTYQEALFLKKYGLQFQADLVGVQFCLNDLHRFAHNFKVENGRIVPGTYTFSSEINRNRSLIGRLADNVHLFDFVREKYYVVAATAKWKAEMGFSFDYDAVMNKAWKDEGWMEIEELLGDMQETGRKNRFPLFLVAFPLAVQYKAEYLTRNRAYVLKPQRKLREIAGRVGIPFLDLYPDMSAHMFIGDGIHLTAEGRRITGRRIARFLVEAGLLAATGS